MTYLDELKKRYETALGAEKAFIAQYREVTGTTLSRLWQHYESNSPFGIITAFKKADTLEKNIADNMDMAREIRRAGYGYVWLKGYWAPHGVQADERDVEDSLFVVGTPKKENELKKLLVRLMRQYDQQAILWKGVDGMVYQMDVAGTVVPAGVFHPDRISQAYSKILRGKHAGREFTFASAWQANNNMGNAFIESFLKQG